MLMQSIQTASDHLRESALHTRLIRDTQLMLVATSCTFLDCKQQVLKAVLGAFDMAAISENYGTYVGLYACSPKSPDAHMGAGFVDGEVQVLGLFDFVLPVLRVRRQIAAALAQPSEALY